MDNFEDIFKSSVFGDIDCESPKEDSPGDVFFGRRENIDSLYEFTGGNILALAGKDFVVFGGDTQLVDERYTISRNQTKMYRATPKAIFATAGCWCDSVELNNVVKTLIEAYRLQHKTIIETEALANLISVKMYDRRLLPYGANVIFGGLDVTGRGAIYFYDPVGNVERVRYRISGTAGALLLPMLDNFYGYRKLKPVKPISDDDLSLQVAVNMVKKVLYKAWTLDPYAGDMGEILIVTSDGITQTPICIKRPVYEL